MDGKAPRSPFVIFAIPLGILAAIMFVTLLSGVPNGPQGGGGSSSLPPAPPQLIDSSLTTNNARNGGIFLARVHTPPQSVVWLLASSVGPATSIGPYGTDLAADWFILQGPTFTGGGQIVESSLVIPMTSTLTGIEYRVQAAVYDPFENELVWTNSAAHRITAPPAGAGSRILVVKQTQWIAEAPHAPTQAEAFAQVLRNFGHDVTVAADAVPGDLASYDSVFDCRCTLAPTPAEKILFLRFLQRYGGIFFLSGPYLGSSGGQLRLAWIQSFLVSDLGAPLVLASGANLSQAQTEEVSMGADPYYLTSPSFVGGLSYEVSEEGGNFGPLGYAQVGLPWIGAPGPTGYVYGMLFKPSDLPARCLRGGVAVLLNGSSSALVSSPSNPNADLVFANLPWYLDR